MKDNSLTVSSGSWSCLKYMVCWSQITLSFLVVRWRTVRISGLSLFSETRPHRLWTDRSAEAKNDECIHSGESWKKRAFIFIHRRYLRIVWICFFFYYLGNRHRLGRLFHHFFGIILSYLVPTPFTFTFASLSTIDRLKDVCAEFPDLREDFCRISAQATFCLLLFSLPALP